MINFLEILQNGVTIASSGTSGKSIEYFQTPLKLQESNRVAVLAQRLASSSKVYTCCKTTHAGGLLAQTVPALSIGAMVDIVPFNAYSFVRDIPNYTHTLIMPMHANAIMLTKGFKDLDLKGVWITCGADPVQWNIIEAFVERGATFMVNWGMSEIGPIAINTVFDSMEKVKTYQASAPADSTILGDTAWCQYKIVDNELFVNGPICIFDGWYGTKDRVIEVNGILYYLGRTNKEIDLWTPNKG